MANNPAFLTSSAKRLWKHIALRRRVQFALLFVLMLFTSVSEVVSIGAVLPFLSVLTAPELVYDYALAQILIKALDIDSPNQLILPITICFSIAAIFSGVMRLCLLWAQTRISHAVGAELSISIYRRTLYQPYSVHVSRNSSEVIAAISAKASSIVNYMIMPVLTILNATMMLFAVLMALFYIDPVVASTAILGFGLIYATVIVATKKRLAADSDRFNKEQNQVFKALQEGLGGIRDVLIDGTQEVYCRIYKDADLPLRRAIANIAIISGSPRYASEALGMVLIAGLAYSISIQAGGITSSIPILGALALGAQRMLPVLQQIYAGWTSIRGGNSTLVEALDLLDQPIPAFADQPKPTPIPFRSEICLDRIGFKYSIGGPQVVDDLSLIIKKGMRVGFIGVTGSGKSTLLDIVMGLIPPTTGELKIDGCPITDENNRSWQSRIAHVPQSVFLSDASIAENIAFGVAPEDIDLTRVREAAQRAQISESIESWSDRYSTMVGERGIRLSGGQRQRIGIARALYKNSDVIVFDEATSALDTVTEQAVMDAIDTLNSDLTILIVAHRLSTLKKCDLIVEVASGKIRRVGNYEEIIA
ncbi:ABC transporter ATP-binding protein/permease [Pseudomonadales bacterium]|nr:ABC transporter ATP-binding protein/permease [Pseudomonadales bacterium]